MYASEIWPDVPAELKYVEFRMPGTFRELVANRNFSDDEIGKIVRCLALNSDFFLTPKIEPEVFYYRRHMIRKIKTRKRVEAYRLKSKTRFSDTSETCQCGVTVTQDAQSDSSCGIRVHLMDEKTPPEHKEKTPPIVPLEKKTLVPLEKKCSSGTRKDAVAKGIQQDLFSMFVDKCKETASGSRTIARNRKNRAGYVQDIGIDPEASETPSGDSRIDTAWIPQRFALFWEKYPRKVAKSDAVKAFSKIIKKQVDVDKFMSVLMDSLKWWKCQPSWTKDGGKFIPYPATWLNRGNWNDSAENPCSGGGAQFLRGDEESDDELIRRMQGG